jgi:hypothetical protein
VKGGVEKKIKYWLGILLKKYIGSQNVLGVLTWIGGY